MKHIGRLAAVAMLVAARTAARAVAIADVPSRMLTLANAFEDAAPSAQFCKCIAGAMTMSDEDFERRKAEI